MKRYYCDVCEEEMFESEMSIHLKTRKTLLDEKEFHLCDKCSERVVSFINQIRG